LELGYHRSSLETQYPIVSFPERAADHRFYERLVEGEPDAVRVFSHRRTAVDGGTPLDSPS
jgi:hypothetical protein